MRYFISGIFIMVFAVTAHAETRCGWFENPTPSNYYLVDEDAVWELSTQGGRTAEGFFDLPAEASDDLADEWVKTDGNYGYGCACIDGEFGTADSREVIRVISMETQTLKQCEDNPALPRR